MLIDNLTWRARLRARLPILATIFVFLLGLYALYHLLAPLKIHDLMAELRAIAPPTIGIALMGTALGYLSLIAFDASALRFLGKSVPRASVLLGGFLGYAVGNTVGLSAISGGTIRYRIYNAYGLDGYDVAKIAAFSSISYGFGATIIGLAALAFHPEGLEGIINLPTARLRMIAIASLLAIGLLLMVLGSRNAPLKFWKWQIALPSPGVMSLQILITLAEVLAGGFVLYTLLPISELSFYAFIVTFTIATMAGVISHVPGGVGVFETIIIAALPAGTPIDQAVAGVLLFRIVYYLLPFILALVLLALTEAFVHIQPQRFANSALAPVLNAARGFAPSAITFLVFASGVYLLVAGHLTDARDVAEDIELILPLAILAGPKFVTSLVGAGLIGLSLGLWYRLWLGYWLLNAAMLAGAVLAYIYGHDIDRSLYLIALLFLYYPFRGDFFRRSRLPQLFQSRRQLILILLTALGLGLSVYFLVLDPHDLAQAWWQTPIDAQGGFDLRGFVVTLSALLFLGFVFLAMRPRHGVTEPAEPSALKRASRIIDEFGHARDRLGLTGDKNLMFAANDRAVIAFGKQGRSWVALGAPIGANDAKTELMWDFVDAARRAGARPIFYEAGVDFVPLALELGFNLFKMGEEAIVNLENFSLDGGERKKLRTNFHRAGREGLRLEILDPPHSHALLAELRAISDHWLEAQKAGEKAFSVGQFDTEYLAHTPIARVTLGAQAVAFANVLLAAKDGSAAIDLMRYNDAAPPETMTFLFTALMLHYRDAGFRRFSLGMAPLSGFDNRAGAGLWTRFGAIVFEHGNRFYSFEGLRQFKSKFDPEWQPRYLITKSLGIPIIALVDATTLISNKRG